jgi:biopolymer transport protein ExbD
MAVADDHPVRDTRFERADTVLERRSVVSETDDEMDITPMIDVTFLLLIFFLLTSRMDPSRGMMLPVAEHALSVSSREAVFLTLAETEAGDVDIYLGNGKQDENLLATADLRGQDEAIAEYVQRTKIEQPGVKKVIIQAERRVKHREVARVARIAQAAADLPLHIAVMKES